MRLARGLDVALAREKALSSAIRCAHPFVGVELWPALWAACHCFTYGLLRETQSGRQTGGRRGRLSVRSIRGSPVHPVNPR